MRRTAPSQIKKQSSTNNSSLCSSSASLLSTNTNNVIQRLPLFNFLEIPSHLQKKFKLPYLNYKDTQTNIELRKRKSYGPKPCNLVIPRGFKPPTKISVSKEEDEEDIDNIEGSIIAPEIKFEPLILWTNPDDSEHTIEV